MASFSVDISEVVFAGAHSGYKDITITGMPQAGVSCTITGTDTSAFNYRIPGSDQNVYRVYTTGLTTTSTSTVNNAVFKITNSSDSTDYVEVQLYQLKSGYVTLDGSVSTKGCVIDVICDSSMFINIPKDWHNTGVYRTYYTSVYANQNNGGDSTAHCTVLLDSTWTIPTSSVPSWIALTQDGYTDTGFKKVLVSVTNNYDGPRKNMLNFNNADWYLDYVWIYQDGYPSSTSGCTETLTFPKSGGTLTATVKHTSTDNNYVIIDTATLYLTYGEDYSAVKDSSSTYSTVYSITIPANTSDGELKTFVHYDDISGSTAKYLGHTTIIQEGDAPVPTLTVDPSVLDYPSSGGGRVLGVTYATSLSTNESSFPSWLGATYVSTGQGSGSYTITAASNTSTSSRSFNFNLADANMSLAVPINQAGSVPSGSLSVSPSSLSFGPDVSYADISLTYGGSYYNVDATEVYTWTTIALSDVSTGYTTGTVSVASNVSTSSRSGNVYFSDELGASIALPIEQAGISYALSAVPSSLSFPASGGSSTTAVTYEGTLSAASLPSWLSQSYVDVDANHRTYTITAASNGPTSSRTFNWRLDDSYDHCWVFISQAERVDPSLVISPTSSSVNSSSGTVEITVRSTNISEVSYVINAGWIEYISKSGSVYTFGYAENGTSDARQGTITFSGGGLTRTFTLSQEAGQAASLSISPSSSSVGSSVGSVQITVTSSGISDVSYVINAGWIEYISKSGSVYTFGYAANGTTDVRQGTITFSGGGLTRTFTLSQAAAQVASLSISPTEQTVSAGTGSVRITVNKTGIENLQYEYSGYNSNFIFSHIEGNDYIFSYGVNTSTTTTYYSYITFSGAGLSERFTLTRQPGSGWYMNVLPTSNTVDGGSGYVYVTLNELGISVDNINYSIDSSWLSYVSNAGFVYKFMYRQNPTGNQRTATVTFSGDGESATYTLIQSPGSDPERPSALKAYPKKLRYYSDGGGILVSFTNRPTAGIGYTITYTDGSGWLSVVSAGPDKNVSATANSGTRRRADIRFYDLNDSTNYVIVPVIQGSVDYYNSIWMDDLYYPENRDSSGNYFYRVVNQNGYTYFTGVSSKPLSVSGDIGGIDVPRLVDNYIRSYYVYQRTGEDWANMYLGCSTVDIYNMTESGYPGVVDATFKYWNDWSRFERRYDYTRSLNDPINCKGCDNMVIPFCVYYDDAATFSVVDTEKNGNVNTYTFSSPSTSLSPFAMRSDTYYDSVRLDYMQDNDVIFSYDMTHCGPGAFIYRNRFGGWDSFLIEGNISKTDNYTKQNYRIKGEYDQEYSIDAYKYIDEKRTDSIDIDTTYEAYTGWLTDEESERLAFHLLSSPIVYFQNLHKENQVFDTDPKMGMMPVRITASSAEYKKFRNGKRLVNYLITFEKCNIEKVRQ